MNKDLHAKNDLCSEQKYIHLIDYKNVYFILTFWFFTKYKNSRFFLLHGVAMINPTVVQGLSWLLCMCQYALDSLP